MTTSLRDYDLTDLGSQLSSAMRAAYDVLISFADSAEFRAVLRELYALPSNERPTFISTILLNDRELGKRHVVVPPGILIQRSSFGDRRPTLFCLKKYLPEELRVLWQNVNLTFDDHYDEPTTSAAQSWRRPLPIDVQALIMKAGYSPSELGD